MRVAVCQTKKESRELCEAFREGVIKHGDDVVMIKAVKKRVSIQEISQQLKKVDVTFQLCWYTTRENTEHRLRKAIVQVQKSRGKPFLILDVGLLHKNRARSHTASAEDKRYLIGFKGFKSKGIYLPNATGPEKWEDLNIDIKPWRTATKPIVVFGENTNGILAYGKNIRQRYKEMVREVRAISDIPIVYRPHPQEYKFFPQETRILQSGQNFEPAWCSVSHTTNAAIDGLIAGIPAIVKDPDSFLYHHTSNNLKDLRNPPLVDREQIFHSLANLQWSLQEMRDGSAWELFKNAIQSNVRDIV